MEATLWGFTDRHSWLPNSEWAMTSALPLDADYHPKPAYCAISDTLQRYAEAHERQMSQEIRKAQ